jgi:integrase
MKSASKRKNGGSKPRPHVQEVFIEDDQYRVILGSLPEMLKPIFVVAYHLPLRKNELLSLCRDQVDLQKKRLLLHRQAEKCGDPTEAPIYGDMSPWLDMLLTKVETLSPSGEHLFVDHHGNPITDFRDTWNKACQLAGIPRLPFRDLRRTAARNMFHCGFAESTIRRVAGVESLNLLCRCTTMDKKDVLAAGRLLQRYFDQQRDLDRRRKIDGKPN